MIAAGLWDGPRYCEFRPCERAVLDGAGSVLEFACVSGWAALSQTIRSARSRSATGVPACPRCPRLER